MKGLVVTEDNKLYLEEKLPIPESESMKHW